MLQLTGRAADGWLPSNPYLPPGQLTEANRIVDEAAADAGRITRVRDELDLLTDTLLSHLSYEERELVEPMARLVS